MTDHVTQSNVGPTPADMARASGLEPSDGPAGDASIDAALSHLETQVRDLTHAITGPDAGAAIQAGQQLHAVLQRRLDEASA